MCLGIYLWWCFIEHHCWGKEISERTCSFVAVVVVANLNEKNRISVCVSPLCRALESAWVTPKRRRESSACFHCTSTPVWRKCLKSGSRRLGEPDAPPTEFLCNGTSRRHLWTCCTLRCLGLWQQQSHRRLPLVSSFSWPLTLVWPSLQPTVTSRQWPSVCFATLVWRPNNDQMLPAKTYAVICLFSPNMHRKELTLFC